MTLSTVRPRRACHFALRHCHDLPLLLAKPPPHFVDSSLPRAYPTYIPACTLPPESVSMRPRCTGPLSRRHFLRIGSLTLAGFGLAGVAPYQLVNAAQERSDPDTSVILLWLPGGPPH